MSRTTRVALALGFACALGVPAAVSSIAASPPAADWVPLFDGKTMTDWEMIAGADRKSKWEVVDGALCGSGEASMLVCTKGPYTNFRYRAEVKINDKGNSGMYFRTTRRPGFTDGYEAQIDSTHSDPIRTGSLYGMCHVFKQHVKPDTWFNYEIEVKDGDWRGKKVTYMSVRINGEELYQYIDFERVFKSGHFAFQQHDPGSKVCIRKVEVMELP